MANATAKKNEQVQAEQVRELALPDTLYGKYVASKKKLVLRVDLPEGAKAFRELTGKQTDAVYDAILQHDGRFAYLLEKLEEGRAAQLGSKNSIREDVRKAAGL